MQYVSISLPSGGLDVSKPAEFIDSGLTPSIKNMIVSRGAMQTRPGTKLFQTAAVAGTDLEIMVIAELLTGTTRKVVRVGLDKIELLTQSTKVWSDITDATAMTGTSTDVYSWCTPILSGARILVLTNYKDAIIKYTGTGNTAALGGTPPKARFVEEFGPYLVLAYVHDGSADQPVRVQWSDAGDIEEWVNGYAGYQDLLEERSNISGIKKFDKYIAVHKENCIYLGAMVATDETINFARTSAGAGTICNNSIKNLPTGEQAFLGRGGIHVFNGNSAPLIGAAIQDELREQINPEYIHKCWSVVAEEYDEYWLGVAIGSQTKPETVYKFNYRTRQAYKDERTGISTCGLFQRDTTVAINDLTGAIETYVGRFDDIYLTKLHYTEMFGDYSGNCTAKDETVTTDNGTAFTAFRETEAMVIQRGQLTRWLEVQVDAKGTSLSLAYSVDKGVTWQTVSTKTLSSAYQTYASPTTFYFDAVGESLSLRFTGTFTMKGYKVGYEAREQVR